MAEYLGIDSPLSRRFALPRLTLRLWVVVSVVVVLVGCQKTPEVYVVPVVRGTVDESVSSVTSGTVRAEQVAELAFGTVGRVRALRVKLGDSVQQGQILAELENDELKSALSTAESEHRRRSELFRVKLLSSSELESSQRALDMAQAAFEKSLVRAPYAGLIAELNLEVGQLSQITAIVPRAPIRIVDLLPRYVRAEIDEVDLPRIKVGLPARIKVLAAGRELLRGTVRKVIPFVSSVREQDRTAEIEVAIEEVHASLPVGASADLEIITATRSDVLLLPSRVVLGRGADRYVFLFRNGEAARTAVRVGIFNFEKSEIVEGLALGDQVIRPAEGFELVDHGKVKLKGELLDSSHGPTL